MQNAFHIEKLICFRLGNFRYGHPGPAGYNHRDILYRNFGVLLFFLSRFSCLPPVLSGAAPYHEGKPLFKLLALNGSVFFLANFIEFLLKLF